MNKLIEELIQKGMGNFMDRSRDALAWADEIYLNDIKDENELEQRYKSLDLTKEQKIIILQPILYKAKTLLLEI